MIRQYVNYKMPKNPRKKWWEEAFDYVLKFLVFLKKIFITLWQSLRSQEEKSVEKNSIEEKGTFQRRLLFTFIGLFHVMLGFLATLWAAVRIIAIGYVEVFKFGFWTGVYNYYLEASWIFLWISGIGILRSKRWGKYLGAFWCVNTILLGIINHYLQKHYWGYLAVGQGWSGIFIIYYSCIFLFFMIIKPLSIIILKIRNKNFKSEKLKEGILPLIIQFIKNNFKEIRWRFK